MISNERVKHTFSGNGSSKKFQIPFDFFKNTAGVFDKNIQISVILTNAAGTERTLTEDTDYEVETWDPSDSGSSGYSGYVHVFTAPAVGEKLTIMRDVPLVQELHLEEGREIGRVELEAALDKVVMTLQQLNEKLGRAICYNPSTTGNNVDAEAYIANLQALFTQGAADVAAATETAVSACEGYANTASTKAAQATAAFEDTVNRMVTAVGASNTAVAAKEAAVDAKNDAVTAKNAAVSAKTGAETAQTAAEAALGTLTGQVSAHNESSTAHADIRTAISGKQDALPSGATGFFLKKTADGVEWAQPSGGGGGGSAEWGNIGGTLPDQTDLKNALDAKQDAISDLSTIRTNATAGAGAAATIAEYGDVVTHNASEFQAAGNYAAASHTHTASEISGLPTVPTKTSQLQNDSGFITDVPVATASVAGKVKPDGITITAAPDGTISAVGGGSSSSLTATYDSTNKVLTLR